MFFEETGVKIDSEGVEDMDSILKTFCHIVFLLKKMREKKLRRHNIELVKLVFEILERQLKDKVDNQYQIESRAPGSAGGS